MAQTSAEQAPLRVVQWVRLRWWNASAWYAVSLAEALARTGHQSYLMAPPDTPAAVEAAQRGLTVPALDDLASSNPVSWVRAGMQFRRFLEEHRIDLVNVHSSPAYLRIARTCRRLGIPVVRTRSDIRPPKAGPLQRWLYGRATNHHLVSADFIRREYYTPLSTPQENISVLRGGIDTARLNQIHRREARLQIRSRLGIPPDALMVGMIARLSPVKGHQDVVNAMAQVCREGIDAHLVLVGRDAQLTRGEIAEWGRAQGMDSRLHLVGRVEDPLVWASALDVAVIASIDSEAVCRSAFEYLGLGIPLIATRVHAIPEVVEEGTGLVVPPQDPRALARSLAALLTSPELREAFGQAGREHILAHYSLERFGEEAAAIFRKVCNRSVSDEGKARGAV